MFMQDETRFAFDTATLITTETPPATGLTAGTLVETNAGWKVAAALRIGMGVYTLEGGLRPVLALDCRSAEVGATVVRLPGGSFDNCSDLDVLPEQDVVLNRRNGLLARIPARMLAGHRGASLTRLKRALDIVTPIFAEDEVIWTNSGTRLYCAGIGGQSVGFVPRLDGADADALLGHRARRQAA